MNPAKASGDELVLVSFEDTHLEEAPLGPWVEEDPHDQVGTELGLLQYWLWLRLQQLQQCLFLVESSPKITKKN